MNELSLVIRSSWCCSSGSSIFSFLLHRTIWAILSWICGGPEKGRCYLLKLLTLLSLIWRSSLAGEQPGCSGERLLVRSSPLQAACWVLRRFSRPTAGGVEWCETSCCRVLRCQPIPRFLLSGTPEQRPSRRVHQRQLSERSYPFGGNDEPDQLGTADQRVMSGTWPWCVPCQIFLVQTWLIWFVCLKRCGTERVDISEWGCPKWNGLLYVERGSKRALPALCIIQSVASESTLTDHGHWMTSHWRPLPAAMWY